MPSQHKHPPISFRPSADDREWLLTYAKATGIPVNRVLADTLTVFRAQLALHCADYLTTPGHGYPTAGQLHSGYVQAQSGAALWTRTAVDED